MCQNDLHLPIKRKIAASQPLAQILVNGGLADAKGGGGRADGRLMLDHVHSQIAGSLLDGFVHKTNLPKVDAGRGGAYQAVRPKQNMRARGAFMTCLTAKTVV